MSERPKVRGEADEFARKALEFVDLVGTLGSKAAVFGAFDDAMADFGFDHFVMVDLPNLTSVIPTVLINKPPIGWTEVYLERGFQTIDPVVTQCYSTARPFEWKDIVPPPSRQAQTRAFLNLAGDFGLRNGLAVPIHNFDGTTSLVSLSAPNPYVNGFTKPALHLMSLYAFEQVRQHSSRDDWVGPPLSAREREVLTWISMGKSAAKIAEILNITERTAVAHTVNAMNKLGATNRTHAVAIALSRRLICL